MNNFLIPCFRMFKTKLILSVFLRENNVIMPFYTYYVVKGNEVDI